MQENQRHEQHHSAMLESLEAKLSWLNHRRDAGAEFARSHLNEWKAKVQARLDAYHDALPEFEAARVAHTTAFTELEQKRAELLAELERAFAPFAQREFQARQALEEATLRATLHPHQVPGQFSHNRDPGDTSGIAGHAHTMASYEGPHYANRCADLAMSQRGISETEMVWAVAAESDPALLATLRAKEIDPKLARAAFDLRWRHFASANGLPAGAPTLKQSIRDQAP